MSKTATNAALRKFISQHFNVPELTSFCFNYFPEIGDEFPPDMPKSARVELLIGYCQRRGLMPNLQTALAREREKPYLLAALSNADSTVLPEKNLGRSPEPDSSFHHPITGKEMVRVPAGPFIYQDGEWAIHLDEFWIDKTPVTHADYKRFIDANPNHEVPFVDEAWAKPYNWNKQLRTFRHELADHPVVLVNWHDAQAYAQWAECDLLSEQQWEKAARGIDGRPYPWGEWQKNHTNTSEASIGKTTPVGQFSPQGDSPYGCVDMSGNAWEWTDSLYREDSSRRVLRGGSWNANANLARAAFRNYFQPTGRSSYAGFRVVVRRPPSHRATDH